MVDFNVFDFIFKVIFKIIEVGRWCYDFLFYQITFKIPFTSVNTTVEVWALLGGALATTLIIASIIKAITPLA